MVKIRLARYGRKKRAFYRIVVTDVRNSRGGKFIENIGYYDPYNKKLIKIDQVRMDYWKSQGAVVNESVLSIKKRIIKANK